MLYWFLDADDILMLICWDIYCFWQKKDFDVFRATISGVSHVSPCWQILELQVQAACKLCLMSTAH